MDSALMQVAVTKMDRRNVSKTLLLNTSRVSDFYADPSTGACQFYYRTHDGRHKDVEILYSGNVSAFKILLRETEQRDDITFNVTRINKFAVNLFETGGFSNTSVSKVSVNLDNFVCAYDKSDSSGSYIFISRGGKIVVYDSTDTISKLDSTASGSGSINI